MAKSLRLVYGIKLRNYETSTFTYNPIGLLFTSPNSFAQSSKPKRATIKYGNGVKYVGEIRKVSPKGFIIRKMKFKHGTGIMYFANGDLLNGVWCYDHCKRGTFKIAF